MRAKTIFYAISFFVLSGCVPTHQQLYNQNPAFYSYIVGNVENNEASLEHKADVYITPASCQKTVTALLAYKALGSDYVYETTLWVTPQRDAIITFSGDPSLRSEQVLKLLGALQGKRIRGKIILDVSLFKVPAYSRNIIIDDMGTHYGRPVSAANLDQNLLSVVIAPTTLGKPAAIENDAGYVVECDVATSVEKTVINLSWNGERIKASGNICVADKPIKRVISPEVIDGYVLNKIKSILKAAHLSNDVVIVKDAAMLPKTAQLIATHYSEPLGMILPPALKMSDNFVFDSLFLKIIHKENPKMINEWQDGDKVFKSLIKTHFNVEMNKALFVDGSGLSRYNRIQPRQLFKLLQKGYKVKEFVNALPKPGEENSTLRGRVLPFSIRAKSGIMSGISCLCGYSIGDSTPQIFVVAAHNFAPPISAINPVLDSFMTDCFPTVDDGINENILL
jgi:D-alanyl-D-alanine carboxypeptidase/D-alanyl-D-alanine-endopeptidase (penicillin-binding protein 4)